MHDPPLGHSPEVDVVKTPVVQHPVDEVVTEQPVAGGSGEPAQCLGFGICEPDVRHPLEQGRQPGADAVARLVVPVVRVRSERVVELGPPLGQT